MSRVTAPLLWNWSWPQRAMRAPPAGRCSGEVLLPYVSKSLHGMEQGGGRIPFYHYFCGIGGGDCSVPCFWGRRGAFLSLPEAKKSQFGLFSGVGKHRRRPRHPQSLRRVAESQIYPFFRISMQVAAPSDTPRYTRAPKWENRPNSARGCIGRHAHTRWAKERLAWRISWGV